MDFRSLGPKWTKKLDEQDLPQSSHFCWSYYMRLCNILLFLKVNRSCDACWNSLPAKLSRIPRLPLLTSYFHHGASRMVPCKISFETKYGPFLS
jgi:hypothetical protein